MVEDEVEVEEEGMRMEVEEESSQMEVEVEKEGASMEVEVEEEDARVEVRWRRQPRVWRWRKRSDSRGRVGGGRCDGGGGC